MRKMAVALPLWTSGDSCVLLPSFIDSTPPEQRVTLVQRPYFDTAIGRPPETKKMSLAGGPENDEKRPALNQGERLLREHHYAIRDRIVSVHAELLELGRHGEIFGNTQSRKSAEDKPGRGIAVEDVPPSSRMFYSLDLHSICELHKLVPHTPGTPVVYLCESTCKTDDVFGHLVINSSAEMVSLEVMGACFSIPVGSIFLLSDAACLEPLVEHCTTSPANCYNVVVLDPPWWNRSVKRSKKYSYLTLNEVSQLPLPSILVDGALVVVWATNKRTLVESIKESLFKKWSVQFVAEWQWLKVTTSGEMVIDLDSVHRKPYETLVVGIHKKCLSKPEGSPEDAGKVGHGSVFSVPQQLVVCSVPTVHSQKPFLGAAIDRCLTGDKGCKGKIHICNVISNLLYKSGASLTCTIICLHCTWITTCMCLICSPSIVKHVGLSVICSVMPLCYTLSLTSNASVHTDIHVCGTGCLFVYYCKVQTLNI